MIYSAVKKEVLVGENVINYTLQYKNVKNINLRIKSDGTISVSANRRIPHKVIENFIISKSDFILSALEKYRCPVNKPLIQYYTEAEIKEVITSLCEKVYPYFEKKGVKFPEIKFRKMVSRWGSCHSGKGVLTLNTYLMYAPIECVEYVVMHEFTHFIEPNHQKAFYEELSKLCPHWKECRNKLKSINIKKLK